MKIKNIIPNFSQIDPKNALSALIYSIVKSGANKILKRFKSAGSKLLKCLVGSINAIFLNAKNIMV